MRVSSVSCGTYVADRLMNSPEAIKSVIESIANRHRVSYDDIIESAISADGMGPPYLTRVLNLYKRLEKLSAI